MQLMENKDKLSCSYFQVKKGKDFVTKVNDKIYFSTMKLPMRTVRTA